METLSKIIGNKVQIVLRCASQPSKIGTNEAHAAANPYIEGLSPPRQGGSRHFKSDCDYHSIIFIFPSIIKHLTLAFRV